MAGNLIEVFLVFEERKRLVIFRKLISPVAPYRPLSSICSNAFTPGLLKASLARSQCSGFPRRNISCEISLIFLNFQKRHIVSAAAQLYFLQAFSTVLVAKAKGFLSLSHGLGVWPSPKYLARDK
jgi:hypothetical protein